MIPQNFLHKALVYRALQGAHAQIHGVESLFDETGVHRPQPTLIVEQS